MILKCIFFMNSKKLFFMCFWLICDTVIDTFDLFITCDITSHELTHIFLAILLNIAVIAS